MINKEEVKQITNMMNWGETKEDMMGIQLRMFKQYDKTTKKYNVKYAIILHEWVDGKQHSSIMADAETVLEAMGKIDRLYAEKKKVQSKLNG